MKHFNRTRILPGILAAASIAQMAETAQAQTLEEVVVTASKRGAQNLLEVPSSLQAFSGEKLDRIGANDFNDFFRLVPSLAVFDQGPGDKRIIIRGVNSTGAGTVGLYLDEVIITGENAQDGGGRQPDIKLFDLERVEVLKGPQGTTFGSNSLSGAIRYITNKPNLDAPELRVSGSLRDLDGADLGGRFDAAASVPIVPGKFAVRGAIYYLDQNGFIDNRFEDGVNSEETVAGRVSALYTPTERFELSLMAMRQDMETDGPYYFNEVDLNGDPLPDNTQADRTRNPFDDETTIYNVTANFTLDPGTFTATASRFERDTVFNRDASAAVGPFSVITQPKDREVDTYELRFASDLQGPFQFLVGGFLQEEDRFFQSRIFEADPDTGVFFEEPGFSLDRNVDTTVEETAVFAELSYDVSESLNITAAGRWFDIEVEEVANAVQGFSGAPGAGKGPELAFSEDDIIGRLNASYDVNDDVMLYAQWAQGFRSGGTNDQTAAEIAQVTIPQGFGSDSLDNYEVGIKGMLADGLASLQLAGYFIDWSDIQIQDQAQDPNNPSLFFPFRSNGSEAEIYGLELDLSLFPIEGLELALRGGYTDAELSADNPIPSTGRDGDQIPYIPEFTGSFSADYRRPLRGRNLEASMGVDVTYVDDRQTELRPGNPLNLALNDYTLVNLRGGIEGESWSAMLNIKNLFDENEVIDVFRILPGLTPDGFIPLQPRMLELTVSKSFF